LPSYTVFHGGATEMISETLSQTLHEAYIVRQCISWRARLLLRILPVFNLCLSTERCRDRAVLSDMVYLAEDARSSQ